MRRLIRQYENKMGFTIVEILTVMSIIVILIGLLVPALNMASRYAKDVRQQAQFHGIDVALQLFSSEFEGYPESDRLDADGLKYCGAMRLAEAMMGQDLLGFNPSSRFSRDGLDSEGRDLYDEGDWMPEEWDDNLRARRGPYLQPEKADAYRLKHLYGDGAAATVFGVGVDDLFVLCDVYGRVTLRPSTTDIQGVSGKAGMPILYYKANTLGTTHPVWTSTVHNTAADADIPADDPDPDYDGVYNHFNNDDLVLLGMPWDATKKHPMASDAPDLSWGAAAPYRFYNRIWDAKVTTTITGPYRPYRADSYILISAGFDGQYGTRDDIFNFE